MQGSVEFDLEVFHTHNVKRELFPPPGCLEEEATTLPPSLALNVGTRMLFLPALHHKVYCHKVSCHSFLLEKVDFKVVLGLIVL